MQNPQSETLKQKKARLELELASVKTETEVRQLENELRAARTNSKTAMDNLSGFLNTVNTNKLAFGALGIVLGLGFAFLQVYILGLGGFVIGGLLIVLWDRERDK